MALIQTGSAIPNGKCGDVVYYSGRWGNVVRDNFTPYNPNSTRQASIRMTYTDLTHLWHSLSKDERNSWAGAIKGGKPSSEYNEFLKHNMNLSKIGQTPIRSYFSTTPTVYTYKPTIRIIKSGPNWFLDDRIFDAIDLPPDQYMVISASTNRASHARQVDPPYRIMTVLPPLTSFPQDIYTSYASTWPIAPIVGMRIFNRLQIVNGLNGDATWPAFASCIVEA